MEITFEQLPKAIAQLCDDIAIIKRHLFENNNVSASTEGDELLTVEQAAEFLSLSKPTIYGLISKGQIPVMKRSKRCYFSKLELMSYLKQGRNKTVQETINAAQDYLSKKTK